MSELLTELAAASRALAERSDRVNAILDDLDEEIEKAAPGVTAWLEDTPIEDDWFVGYTKVGDRWCLAAHRKTEPPSPPVALSKAPRVVRIAAVAQRQAIVGAITERVRFCIASIGAP